MTELADMLRKQGHRLTRPRLLMLEVLSAGGDHLSAEQMHAEIGRRNPEVNLSTVYRTLEMLVSVGIVREADLGGGRRFFELTSESDPHHHLVCRGCGRIEHIAGRHLDEVESHVLTSHGFAIEETALTSFGRCRSCQT
jgi:Fur family ferric uptake transcriptional regulator